MNNFLKVAVFDTGNDLMEEVTCFVGGETAFGYDVVEQFAAGYVFVDEEDIGGCIDDFVEADDVWVGA